jgi:glycine/D-amino acid oxidase-like deaminating enzyme
MGSSSAWWLTNDKTFDGSILVVERDPTYEKCCTALCHSCVRQQFSTELNVRISQFTADFVKNLREYMGGDERVPELRIRNFGYMYLAGTSEGAQTLRENFETQQRASAKTRLLTPGEIAAEFPFYHVDDLVLGSINPVDEGYFDGYTIFEWFRRQARERGVEYIANEVVAMTMNAAGTKVDAVTLKSGETVACGTVINASGTRAALTANMAGIALPVRPIKRLTWIFTAEKPLDRDLPLTIDPSGVTVRENGGGTYLSGGGHQMFDDTSGFDDFSGDWSLWESYVWPIVAARVPQFEAVKLTHAYAAHYDMNEFDHNAIVGPHTRVQNFHFINGFSGHGLQQSPAMGRGMAEMLIHGAYRTLDLTPFHYDRVENNEPIVEKGVI